jgi:hypothetical protein
MGFASPYLQKQRSFLPAVEIHPHDDVQLIVVIPCYNGLLMQIHYVQRITWLRLKIIFLSFPGLKDVRYILSILLRGMILII